jgi:Ca-activated chloride channel family protein
MVAIASRARALSLLVAAGGTLVAALALTPAEQGAPRASCSVREHADDGMRLQATWTSRAEDGEHVVVEIAAPGDGLPARPPLSVVIAIDHSKSMTGEPLAHAKAAMARLVSQLDEGDAFAVVAYSDDATTIVPMLPVTAFHKQLAQRAIAELAVDNGTCISCGLELAGAWLGRTPVEAGVRRVVLISDGYANLGLRDRDELVQLAAGVAARGASITAVGVGLDFDAQTMMRIAEVGRGNYHDVADSGRLDAAFDREVAGLAEVIATNVQLTVGVPPGVRIEEVLGYATIIAGDSVSIPLADWEAGEQRTVVMRVSGRPAPCSVLARLGWRGALDGSGKRALAVARIVTR